MTRTVDRRYFALAVAFGGALLGAFAVMVFSVTTSGDYEPGTFATADNAAPGLQALAHGHLALFAARQPAIGLTSLLLRLPAIWVANDVSGHPLLGYRLGVVLCSIPLAMLLGWLAVPMIDTRRGALAAAATVGLLLLAPETGQAMWVGHPEELLAATLESIAVLLAVNARPTAAGLVLGLAVGAKPWAVMALIPVWLALPGSRRRMLAIALVVAGIACGLPVAMNPGAYRHATEGITDFHVFNRLGLLWPLGARTLGPLGGSIHRIPFGLGRGPVLLASIGIALVALALYRRRYPVRESGQRLEPLVLLALLGFLRCICDPVDSDYYLVAALVPLAVSELRAGRLPLLLAAAVLACRLVFGLALGVSPVAGWAITVVAEFALVVVLADASFGRDGRWWSRSDCFVGSSSVGGSAGGRRSQALDAAVMSR